MFKLYVEQDAKTMARLAGAQPPLCDGLIVRLGRPDDVLAASLRSNPLADNWLWDLEIPTRRIVTYSGTLAPELFDRHPANWMTAGRTALQRLVDQIVPQLRRHDMRLCLQPHSRHILSDAQTCAKFLDRAEGQPLEIALAPASLLEPGMLPAADDHLRRAFEMLGQRCAMVILHDVVLSHDGDALVPAPLGSGLLPRDAVLAGLRTFLPTDVPVVIGPQELATQLQWLEMDQQTAIRPGRA
jgi:hypothetical protein